MATATGTLTVSTPGRGVSARMVEWGMLALVVLVFVGVFGQHVRAVQGQGERASVMSTLGALRTALVVSHLQSQLNVVHRAPSAQPNPFLTLDAPLPNYAGEKSVLATLDAPPGSWVYDPQCGCIGYLPLNPKWLDAPPDAAALWFKVKTGSGAPELVPMDQYIWQGLVVY